MLGKKINVSLPKSMLVTIDASDDIHIDVNTDLSMLAQIYQC